MKVLQLGPWPPPYGGVQTNLVAIRSFLLKRGVPCAVINVTRHRKPPADDVYYPSSAVGLLRLLSRLEYDIIHYHFGGMLTRRVLALGMACTLQRKAKSILTFHSGGFPSSPEGQAVGPSSAAAFVLGRFDGLIAVNEEILDFFRKLRISSQSTRLISPYSFVRDGSIAEFPAAITEFFDTHGPVMISAGQLEPEYDLPLQIDALARIRSKFPNAGLLLLGSGNVERKLRQKIEGLNLAGHALLAGDVPHNAAIGAISRSDLMLRTTLYDGDAISVREALQTGIPVIATDTAMRPSGIRLIPQSDLDALVRAIEAQLAQPKNPRRESQSDETNLQAVFNFYQELLAAK